MMKEENGCFGSHPWWWKIWVAHWDSYSNPFSWSSIWLLVLCLSLSSKISALVVLHRISMVCSWWIITSKAACGLNSAVRSASLAWNVLGCQCHCKLKQLEQQKWSQWQLWVFSIFSLRASALARGSHTGVYVHVHGCVWACECKFYMYCVHEVNNVD